MHVSYLSFTIPPIDLHFVPTNYSIPMQGYSHTSAQFFDTSEGKTREVSWTHVLKRSNSLRFTGREPVTGAV